jgi:hypothetical protein
VPGIFQEFLLLLVHDSALSKQKSMDWLAYLLSMAKNITSLLNLQLVL